MSIEADEVRVASPEMLSFDLPIYTGLTFMRQLIQAEKAILCTILEESERRQEFVSAKRFRADHFEDSGTIDEMIRKRYLLQEQERYKVSVTVLSLLNSPAAQRLLESAEKMWTECRNHYRKHLDAPLQLRMVADRCNLELSDTQRVLAYMLEVPWAGGWSGSAERLYEAVAASETVLKFETFAECVVDMTSWSNSPLQYYPVGPFFEIEDGFRRDSKEPASPTVLPPWIQRTPPHVQALVQEVYVAKSHNLLALSAMGIRAVIDAVSFDVLEKDVGTFASKLGKLRDDGHMTTVQHAALTVVVNAGNAAAHRGFIPEMDSVDMMLDALNHLLQSIYVLEHSSRELSAKTPAREK